MLAQLTQTLILAELVAGDQEQQSEREQQERQQYVDIRLSDSSPCMTLCLVLTQVPFMALCQCCVCQLSKVAVVRDEDTLHRILCRFHALYPILAQLTQ